MRLGLALVRGLTLAVLWIAQGPWLPLAAAEAQEHAAAPARARPSRGTEFDTPGDEEDLNREIWRASGRRGYDALMASLRWRQLARTPVTAVSLPNGWTMAPAGLQVPVGRLPFEGVVYRDRLVVLNAGYTGKDPQTLSVLDPATGRLEHTLRLASLYPSAAVGEDGDLYVSGGFGRQLHRFGPDFQLRRSYPLAGYGGPLAALDPHHLVVGLLVAPPQLPTLKTGGGLSGPLPAPVAASAAAQNADAAGRLVVLNSDSGQVERRSTDLFFPTAIRVIGDRIYVAALGEQQLRVYDRQLHLVRSLHTGRLPFALCGDQRDLYVLNSGADSISVVDPRHDQLRATVDLTVPGRPRGRTPSSCAVDDSHLYVTLADINAVAVLERSSNALLGFIPTGWYPTKVISHGSQLLTLSAKGIRPRRPNPGGPGGDQYVLALLQGSAGLLAKDRISAELPGWSRTVLHANPLLTPGRGFLPPIRHIVYVVKENRTYDQVLGDLPAGDGDPSLALFGEAITPNHHALARRWVTLDNVFVNGEVSVLGHSFTTSGYASPFLELLANLRYSGRWSGYPFGLVPATFSPRYLWDALEERGVEARIYGEPYYLFTSLWRVLQERYGPASPLLRRFTARTLQLANQTDRGRAFSARLAAYDAEAADGASVERLLERPPVRQLLSEVFTGDASLAHALAGDPVLRRRLAARLGRYSFAYPPYDLQISDLERVARWKADFQRQLSQGQVAPLQYLWLPNDHTAGADPAFPRPAQLVAQNDAALGEVIATLSRSPIWGDTLVLVVEDDAQNGPDHVDATRTVALAAGPWVRRGAVIHDRFDQLSILRTIALLLGLQPLNLGDALAAPMFSLFSPVADPAPYSPPAPSAQLLPQDRLLLQRLQGASAVQPPPR